MIHLIGIVVIGFIAGLIARLLSPAPNNPQGFLLTAVLGIVGAMVATYLGQAVHLYPRGHNAGFIGAVVGAVIVLAVWHWISRSNSEWL